MSHSSIIQGKLQHYSLSAKNPKQDFSCLIVDGWTVSPKILAYIAGNADFSIPLRARFHEIFHFLLGIAVLFLKFLGSPTNCDIKGCWYFGKIWTMGTPAGISHSPFFFRLQFHPCMLVIRFKEACNDLCGQYMNSFSVIEDRRGQKWGSRNDLNNYHTYLNQNIFCAYAEAYMKFLQKRYRRTDLKPKNLVFVNLSMIYIVNYLKFCSCRSINGG